MGAGKKTGKLIVSLDFELMWGVRDLVSIKEYGNNISGVHEALPKILSRFSEYDIKGTFAIVGFLFFKNKAELQSGIPVIKPSYENANLSPYGNYLENEVGQDELSDPYHYGFYLTNLIKNTPHQEIGSHTFCHYYCLEGGQTVDEFREDLKAAIAIAEKRSITMTSIIFPRNQFNKDYLQVCKEAGIITYRNNEQSWLYNARSFESESLLRRGLRLLDAYINLSGHHCYNEESLKGSFPINIPSSRFLRPYHKELHVFEGLRLRRIKTAMTYAAKNNLVYHLWWHPHNFGINQDQNFAMLEKILQHYRYLNNKYTFTSYTMTELAEEMIDKKNKQPNIYAR